MRKVVISDSGALALPLEDGQEKPVKLTCPYSIRQCRTNCALFAIDPETGPNGVAVCCSHGLMEIGELV